MEGARFMEAGKEEEEEAGEWKQLELRLRVTFTDSSGDVIDFLGAEETPGGAAPDGIQERQPIFERRILEGLPLVKPAVADMEKPTVAHMLGINMDLFTGIVPSSPTDFRLSHGRWESSRGQVDARDGQGRDSFAAPDEPERFVGGGLNPDHFEIHPERLRDLDLHLVDMR